MRSNSVFVIAVVLFIGGEVSAQEPPRYSPSRATVSPYLNLLRNNTGPLPAYHGLVRPALNQQAYNQQQTAQSAMQNVQLQSLADRRTAGRRPTGTGSVFRNLSHYYPARRPFRRR